MQEKEEEEEDDDRDGPFSQSSVSLCPGWQRPAQSQKRAKSHQEGRRRRGLTRDREEQRGTGRDWARCEMADGRWQQGTPASLSTGWAGLWTWWGGAVERRGGKEQ